MQTMMTIINSNGGLLATALAIVVFFNLLVGAIQKGLDIIDPTPEQKAASKLYQIVGKCVSISQNVLDWLSSNRAH